MIKLLFATILWVADSDSLRMETINGKQFIIHQIEAKETLYSISRRYGVAVTAIIESNGAAEGALAVGQLLKIPYTPKAKTKINTEVSGIPAMKSVSSTYTVAAKETLYSIARQYSISVDQLKQWNNLTSDELKLGQLLFLTQPKYATANATLPQPGSTPQSLGATHTVASKETLYSISRQYGVSVDQLKQWNNLTSDELKLGQTLLVAQPKNTAGAMVAPTSTTTPSNTSNTTTNTIKISEKVMGADEVREEGGCDLMANTENSRKYLAFHRTAKIGSVLKVRNTQTNREVFVRVMGAMPNDVPSDVLIRISSAAMNRLEALDGKCTVEVTYYK
ncbi:MAG: LysM peptidoglycan-binding domain-containing protein [Bacteroidota bacterium]|jgi:LysM repeat protein|nr:LysM peptidoglycan-binding domain-containing protein [Flammeovirgaceae bacterium]MCZ8070102.1 LysM peptidoglycan-binding domain-containing protein [Cytophagales bacterium]